MDIDLAAQTLLAACGTTPLSPVLPNQAKIVGFLSRFAAAAQHPAYRVLVADRVARRIDRKAFNQAMDALMARLAQERDDSSP